MFLHVGKEACRQAAAVGAGGLQGLHRYVCKWELDGGEDGAPRLPSL